MLFFRILWSVAASTALVVGSNAVLFAQNEAARVAPSDAAAKIQFDESLLDVKPDQNDDYYVERLEALFKAIETTFGPTDFAPASEFVAVAEEADSLELEIKISAAIKECFKNLAESEAEAGFGLFNFAFSCYVEILADEGNVAELEALAKKHADHRRISRTLRASLFEARLRNAFDEPNPAEIEKIGNEIVETALADERFAWSAERSLIQIAKFDAETKVLAKALDAFQNAESQSLQVVAKELEKTLRLVGLVGQELEIEGVWFDGTEIDWEAYRGKVVLIVVRQSWRRPYFTDVERLLKLYEKYNQAGFEILGYSIDSNLETDPKFAKNRETPWKIAARLLARQAEKEFVDLAEYYGTDSTTILVGKDGKAIDVDASGARLLKRLKKEFPEVK